jgi:hypothetical protein
LDYIVRCADIKDSRDDLASAGAEVPSSIGVLGVEREQSTTPPTIKVLRKNAQIISQGTALDLVTSHFVTRQDVRDSGAICGLSLGEID